MAIDHPAGEECQWDWLDMLARNDLGSWLWRQNPNPDRPNHSQLGWAPARDYNEPPEMVGVMIHPLYLWHPDGEPAGYPAGNLHQPWKWWPIAPAYEFPEQHSGLVQVSIGGCHRPGEPYLWNESSGGFIPGLTIDGGPVWARPGVVENPGIVPFWRDMSEDRQEEFGQSYRTPRTHLTHGGSYHPPIPCQDIADGKYEPRPGRLKVDLSTYQGWMPAVGDQPHPDWTNPDNPFTR